MQISMQLLGSEKLISVSSCIYIRIQRWKQKKEEIYGISSTTCLFGSGEIPWEISQLTYEMYEKKNSTH